MKYVLFTLALVSQIAAADVFDDLNWEYTGEYDVPNQNATIQVMDDQGLLRGHDAALAEEEINGVPSSPNAVLFNNDYTRYVITEEKLGFVKMDDWEDNIDAQAMLDELVEGTEEDNKHRKNGQLFIDGWAQEPTLDKNQATMYYALKLHDDQNNHIVNARAMKLSREGYSQITWIGEESQFLSAEESLAPILEQLKYKAGFTYQDFVPETDTVAAVGAGALMYKLVTGKVVGKGGLAILGVVLAMAKKFWFLLFAPFIWIKKKLFKSEKSEPTSV
ncbi:DUF2167 domain-containing protein [Vibrio sp. CAU 1672]|uniref:DUF2167 domain-containing protein n=1 Tax=Vibrio sp. CAU 1672 TaxID=3032594 RepID=UPI0023DBF92C|nr:DUF2167 domain-containing protein [Vibrio sp. CAU 1672]MDF2153355.1 DUF2167 domain-containing protein [Vibrio sp. CAU 1672]